MRIYIITMDDPVQTYDFIKTIIDQRKGEIVGLAMPKGDRLTLPKGRSKSTYLLTLMLIMGPWYFAKNALIALGHKLKKLLAKKGVGSDPTIAGYAESQGIPVKRIKTPNSKAFRAHLESLEIDVIINQSQSIIKKQLLDIPKIGVLNRHNALLPKNRGRLTPFWVLYKGEKETGVSIHFVEEGIDSGDIVVQERFPIAKGDGFNSIVKKNYQIAALAMLKALKRLEKGECDYIENNDEQATYNSVPTLKDAWRYRLGKNYIEQK